MSFLKGIFGGGSSAQQKTPSPTHHHPQTQAPPAHPFPPQLAAQAERTHSPRHDRRTSLQQHQQHASTPSSQQQQQPQPAMSLGGDSDGGFDLFDGLSLKVPSSTPATSAAQPNTSTVANGQQANGLAVTSTPASVPASTSAAPATESSASMDDMFSGLTVSEGSASGPTEVPNKDADTGAAEGGSSLLSMLNGDSGSGSGEAESEAAAAPAVSGFSFLSETTSADNAAETDAVVPETSDDGAGAATVSSFSFLSSSPATESLPATDGIATRKSSIGQLSEAGSAFGGAATTTSSAVSVPASSSSLLARLNASSAGQSLSAPTFESVHGRLDRSLASYWDDLRSLLIAHSSMRQKQMNMQSKLDAQTNELSELEARQAKEVEEENYESAAQLDAQIEALKVTLAKTQADLDAITRSITEQQSRKNVLKTQIRHVVDECSRQLFELSKDRTSSLRQLLATETSKLEAEEDALQTSLDRTRRNMEHSEHDSAKLKQDEESILQLMSEETKEMDGEASTLRDQLTTLEAERDRLRALLNAAEEAVALASQKLDVVLNNIESARATHSKKLARIHEKQLRLDEEKNQAKEEEATLLKNKEDLDRAFELLAVREKNASKWNKKLEKQMEYIEKVVRKKLEKDDEKEEEKVETPSAASVEESKSADDSSSLESLQSSLTSTLQSLDSSRASLAKLESLLESERESLESLSSRLPTLLAEKASAVAARDFKRAAIVSKESKELQQAKQEREQAIQSILDQSNAERESITKYESQKVELSKRIAEKQAEADQRTLFQFLKRRSRIQRQLAKIQRNIDQEEQEAKEEEKIMGKKLLSDESASPDSDASTATAPSASSTLSSSLTSLSPYSLRFSFLTHELQTMRVEEELVELELRTLRTKHGWDDEYMRENAEKQVEAEAEKGNDEGVDTDVEDKEETVNDKSRTQLVQEQNEQQDEQNAKSVEDQTVSEEGASPATDASPDAPVVEAESTPVAASPTDVTSPAALSVDNGDGTSAEGASPAPLDSSSSSPPAAASSPTPLPPRAISDLRSRYVTCCSDLDSTEQSLQQAIADDEFESAEELDARIQELKQRKEEMETTAAKHAITLDASGEETEGNDDAVAAEDDEKQVDKKEETAPVEQQPTDAATESSPQADAIDDETAEYAEDEMTI